MAQSVLPCRGVTASYVRGIAGIIKFSFRNSANQSKTQRICVLKGNLVNPLQFKSWLVCGSKTRRIGEILSTTRQNQQNILNALGSMFAAIIFLGFSNVVSVQPVVDVERIVLYREKGAGMYSALPYAIAQLLIEVPYIYNQTLVYGVIVYALTGMKWTATQFFWYLFFMFFTFLYTTYYGMIMAAVTPNATIASVLSSACIAVWMIFSGFIIPRPRIPLWWRWYYWACPFAWTLYGLAVSQFGDISDEVVMADGEKQQVNEFLSNYFGYKHDFLGPVAVATVTIALLFAAIFALSIRTLNFQNR